MADKLGTIETGEWTPNELTKWTGKKSPLISVRCKFGRIVASVGGDAGEYDDIYVDLITDDGRSLQLATISCCEEDLDESLVVYAWNGMDEEYANATTVKVDESSFWYSF